MELFKKCEGYEDSYEVGNLGTVRSVARYVVRSDTGTPVFCRDTQLVPTLDRRGYQCVYLSRNSKQKRFRIHRLVAKAFIPNPENLPQVNHKDGNKCNNCASNLEWASNQSNMKHAVDTGLKAYEFGEKAHAFTGAVEAYDRNGNLIATMRGNKEMAEHGFDYRLVSAVLHGKRNSHRGCTFVKLDKEESNEL